MVLQHYFFVNVLANLFANFSAFFNRIFKVNSTIKPAYRAFFSGLDKRREITLHANIS